MWRTWTKVIKDRDGTCSSSTQTYMEHTFCSSLLMLLILALQRTETCSCTSPQPASTIWPSQGSDVSGVRWAMRGTVFVYALYLQVCVKERDRQRGRRKRSSDHAIQERIRNIRHTAILWKAILWRIKACTDSLHGDCTTDLLHCRYMSCRQGFALGVIIAVYTS